MRKHRYSEIFLSFQGEGCYTGRSTAWLRLFMCNLQCDGFGQKDPTDPSTYILPYQEFDVNTITKLEELPVWQYGCDSSYSVAKKFKHLNHCESASVICDRIQDTLRHPSNIFGLFLHPDTYQSHHFGITGGEPMLPQNQLAIIDVLNEFSDRSNLPEFVTVETNGTQVPSNIELCRHITANYPQPNYEWFWSVSPKLWSTSGEKSEKAIKPEVVAQYAELSNCGQLKFVVNGSEQSWDEVQQCVHSFRQVGVDWQVYIMAVGATKEEQEQQQISDIAMEAMRRGYHFSGRLHAHIFGNKLNT